MKDFLKNYISWQFDRTCTREQKLKRFKDLENYILQLYEKLFCKQLWKTPMRKEIGIKYWKLLIEWRDLLHDLNLDDDVKIMDELEGKMIDIKCENKICIACGAGRLLECRCFRCDKCKLIPELCFCKNN